MSSATSPLAGQIDEARKHGYSDDDIVGYLGKKRTDLAPKFAEAKRSGYASKDVLDHLAKAPSQPPGAVQAGNEVGQNVRDFGKGVGKQLVKRAIDFTEVLASIPVAGAPIKAALATPDAQKARKATEPTNTAQKVGRMAEETAEFAIPGEAEEAAASGAARLGAKGGKLLSKVAEKAVRGASAGVVSASQTGSLKEGAKTAALVGPLSRASAAKGLLTEAEAEARKDYFRALPVSEVTKGSSNAGAGSEVRNVPISDLVPTQDVSSKLKTRDVERYRQMLRSGSEPPPLSGKFNPETGKVELSEGHRRLASLTAEGRTSAPVIVGGLTKSNSVSRNAVDETTKRIAKLAKEVPGGLGMTTSEMADKPRTLNRVMQYLSSYSYLGQQGIKTRREAAAVKIGETVDKWLGSLGFSSGPLGSGKVAGDALDSAKSTFKGEAQKMYADVDAKAGNTGTSATTTSAPPPPPGPPLPVTPISSASKSRIANAVGTGASSAGTLPRELAGAKPRYHYGQKQFTLKFANDIDRAAYITAQENKSGRDADYLKFAMEQTGMSETQVRTAGRIIRNRLKDQARNSDPGLLEVEESSAAKMAKIRRQVPEGAATAPQTAPPSPPTQTAGASPSAVPTTAPGTPATGIMVSTDTLKKAIGTEEGKVTSLKDVGIEKLGTPEGDAAKLFHDARNVHPDISFSDAQHLRSELTDMLRKDNQDPKTRRVAAIALDNLNHAMETAAKKEPGLWKAYQAANDFYRHGMETFENEAVAQLMKRNPETLANSVGKGQVSNALAIRRAMTQYIKYAKPEDAAQMHRGFDAFRDQWVRTQLLKTPERGAAIDLAGLKGRLQEMKGPVQALFRFDPKSRTMMRNLDTLGEAISRMQKIGEHGLARLSETAAIGGGVTSALIAMFTGHAGAAGEALAAGTAGVAMGEAATAAIVNSLYSEKTLNKFISAMEGAARNPTPETLDKLAVITRVLSQKNQDKEDNPQAPPPPPSSPTVGQAPTPPGQ